MNEQQPVDFDPAAPDRSPVGPDDGAAAQRTGDEGVDEAIAHLDELDGRPVAEHVALFEAAHDRLRSALSDAGQTPS